MLLVWSAGVACLFTPRHGTPSWLACWFLRLPIPEFIERYVARQTQSDLNRWYSYPVFNGRLFGYKRGSDSAQSSLIVESGLQYNYLLTVDEIHKPMFFVNSP